MTTTAYREEITTETSGPASRRRWSISRHVYGVLGVFALTLGTHLALLVQDWRNLTYKSFDSVIFDQAVRGYSRFEPPRVPLKGVYAGLGPDFVQLGDHFSPIHALLAPLYWIWDDVRMLFVAQAVLHAVAAVLVWRFARRALGVGPAYLVAIAFGVSWGLQSAMDVGYHELDVAVPILALAIERLYADRHRQALFATAALLLVKEDMGLLVAALGLLFFLRGRRRLGVGVSLSGLVWSALAIKVFVPAFGGNSQQYWTYGALGPGPKSAALFVVTHPWKVLEIAAGAPWRQQLLLWLVAVALGGSLLSPITLLAIPSLALRLLSNQGSYQQVYYHYNAPLMVIMFMAGVDGIARLSRWYTWLRDRRATGGASTADPDEAATPTVEAAAPADGVPATPGGVAAPAGRPAPPRIVRRLAWTWAFGVLAVAVYGCVTPTFAFSKLTDLDAWHQTPYQKAAFAVVHQIPRDATVEADDAIGVLISSRTRNLVLVDKTPHDSQYVVLGAPSKTIWPFTSRQEILDLKQEYLTLGYRVVWERDNVWLLRRAGA